MGRTMLQPNLRKLIRMNHRSYQKTQELKIELLKLEETLKQVEAWLNLLKD